MTARQWGEISLAALCFLVDALIELCQLPAANSAAKSTPQLFIWTVREAGQTAWFSTAEWSVAQCVGDGRAAAPDAIRAAEGEHEDNETPGKVWSIYLIDDNW